VRKNRKLTILVNELKEELAEAGRQKKEYAAASKENERLRERLAALETQVGRPFAIMMSYIAQLCVLEL
jgi:cell shape-determining protein MreC